MKPTNNPVGFAWVNPHVTQTQTQTATRGEPTEKAHHHHHQHHLLTFKLGVKLLSTQGVELFSQLASTTRGRRSAGAAP